MNDGVLVCSTAAGMLYVTGTCTLVIGQAALDAPRSTPCVCMRLAGSSPITSMYVHVPIPYSCVSWPASPASPNQKAQGSGGFLIRPMGKSKGLFAGASPSKTD
ncbi:hypothetical protein H0G86_003812 [Trichoderma simmonsii]|uniref:Uncharacterized protein n=1 Tax=Trichoderma simmonsii TaxID=1491479 RepID=A0A8G0PDJ9_9HYPO|nr:hypothetical protein H0G86_003812 [Trichoderma simmonsii]